MRDMPLLEKLGIINCVDLVEEDGEIASSTPIVASPSVHPAPEEIEFPSICLRENAANQDLNFVFIEKDEYKPKSKHRNFRDFKKITIVEKKSSKWGVKSVSCQLKANSPFEKISKLIENAKNLIHSE